MDAPELTLVGSEGDHVANMPSHPTSQYFDDSLFLSEQLGNELPAQWNSQAGLEPHEMGWLPQSEDNMQTACANYSGQTGIRTQNQSMSLNISDTIDFWADLMDFTPDFDFNDGTSEQIDFLETDMNLSFYDHNTTGEPASKPRRVSIDNRQKAILTEWIATNPEPYPSKEQKMSLACSTGLTLNQISSWFTRTRQRNMNRVHVTSTSMNIRNDLPLKPDHFVIPEEVLSPRTHTSASLGIFEGVWPSSISLPEHFGECPMRNPPSESRSLPPFFTLDFIGPVPSPSSQDQLSLEALVSASWSAGSRGGSQERRKRLTVLYEDHNHHRSIDVTTKFDFIKVWIADVAQHKFYPSEEGDGTLLTDGTNGHVIGESEPPKVSQIPEHLDRDKLDQQELIRFRNRLSQLEQHCETRQKKRNLEEARGSKQFDAMSSAGSSASSTASAPSYMSFGPRKGRRVAFQGKRIIMPDASSAAAGSVSCPDEIISRHKRVPYEREASNLSAGEGGQITPAGTVIYPCTFCGKKFYNPFIWRRHEVSAHAPQVQWVCGLDKPTDLGAGIVCPICVAQSGADSAACAHRFDECWEKPKSQRAFFRKDALKQHVRIVHCKGDLPLLSRGGINLDDWKEEIDTSKYNLTCHFCGFTCKTWNSRASHLTMHFVDQIPINLWIPGGPYALISASSTLYKSHLCPFPVSEILNGNMGWRCPLDVFDYSPTLTMSTQRDNIWECNLCGSEVAVGLVKTLFHLKSAHNHNNPCELSSPIFSHANEFFEHLITNHSAVRGDWMAELLLTTLQRYSG